MDPERYFELVLQKTDFILEERTVDGSDARQSIFSDSFGGLNQKGASKPEDIVVIVDCTLDEFYNGSIKQVEYERGEVQHDAKTVKIE
jgi:DnaJ-class molecular chaperone